jgi:hypothetical protein
MRRCTKEVHWLKVHWAGAAQYQRGKADESSALLRLEVRRSHLSNGVLVAKRLAWELGFPRPGERRVPEFKAAAALDYNARRHCYRLRLCSTVVRWPFLWTDSRWSWCLLFSQRVAKRVSVHAYANAMQCCSCTEVRALSREPRPGRQQESA